VNVSGVSAGVSESWEDRAETAAAHGRRACDETPAKADFSKVFPAVCDGGGYFMMPNRVEKGGWRNTTLAELAEWLPGLGDMDRPMVDRTGLKGRYDFTIEFTPEPNGGLLPASDAAADLPGSTFIQAVRDQSGLKLEPVKAEIRLLVIDHIERPSGN
jgi:bla regulator protein BlaR1